MLPLSFEVAFPFDPSADRAPNWSMPWPFAIVRFYPPREIWTVSKGAHIVDPNAGSGSLSLPSYTRLGSGLYKPDCAASTRLYIYV